MPRNILSALLLTGLALCGISCEGASNADPATGNSASGETTAGESTTEGESDAEVPVTDEGGDRDETTGPESGSSTAFSKAAAQAWRNAVNDPPPDWNGNVFQLSHDYPSREPVPPEDGYPWEHFSFENQPAEYMQAVLDYARADLQAIDWDPAKMKTPTWFHAPWMALGPASGNGREFIHGMTRERASRIGELSPDQTNNFIPNYAVGLYNDVGGWTFGRVWADPGKPDLSDGKAIFNNGAMAIKLLFTAADPAVPGDGVPYLKNSKEWQANIAPYQSNDRVPKTLRLLQVDIAVRDKRNDSVTGWLLGTFVYNGNRPGETPFDRLAPVGLMWGDSPGVTPADVTAGRKPSEQWINENVGTFQHLGWARRLNGPVDNPASSCMSCHGGGAETPVLSPMLPPGSAPDSEKLKWFTNIRAGETRDPGATSLDYSLQMSVAITNWSRWSRANSLAPPSATGAAKEYEVDRGEEPRE